MTRVKRQNEPELPCGRCRSYSGNGQYGWCLKHRRSTRPKHTCPDFKGEAPRGRYEQIVHDL